MSSFSRFSPISRRPRRPRRPSSCWFAWWLAIVVLAAPALARADEGRLRGGGDLEFGALVSPSRSDRSDVAGLFSLQARGVVRATERVQVALAIGIPVTPSISLQVPLAVEVQPWRAPFRLRAGVRGIYALTDLCSEEPAACPMEQALDDPTQRGGWIFAVAGEAGASYEWDLPHGLALRVAGAYLGGPAWGRRRHAETPISGYYQGAVLSVGVVSR